MLILYYLHPNAIACTVLVYLKTVVCALSAQDSNTLLDVPLSAFFTKCLCKHSNVNNTLYATNLFRIPIVVVSPGPEPVTRSQRMTMIDSGHELKLHPDDFQNFERQSYPIVIAWNGHNHFVATCVMSDMQHNQWKLKELTILTEASLKVITDINPVKCTDAQRVQLEVLKDNMELSRTLFAPHTCSTSSAEETSAGARPRSRPRPRPRPTSTPLFTNVPDAPGNVSSS